MIGTSARPFSVSAYSTRGGTSGNVWRATMPSSSSARSRSDSVRGRDAGERALELAEARAAVGEVADHEQRPLAAHDVGGPADGTIGVRHERAVYRKTSPTEVAQPSATSTVALVAAPHDAERQRAAGGRVERVEQVVDAAERRGPPARTIRSPRASPARSAGLSSTTPRTSRPSRSGQPDGAAQAPRVAGRRERHAEPWAPGRLAARERRDPRAQRLVGGHGEDQPALAADGVEPEQVPGEVDERAARGAARQRRGVLDRAADAAPARPAEAAAGGGHEPEGQRAARARSGRRARAPARRRRAPATRSGSQATGARRRSRPR